MVIQRTIYKQFTLFYVEECFKRLLHAVTHCPNTVSLTVAVQITLIVLISPKEMSDLVRT